jgi:hypothetical protein
VLLLALFAVALYLSLPSLRAVFGSPPVIASRKLIGEAAKGFHLYQSLDLLFRMVNEGHRPRRSAVMREKEPEDSGIRFEPLKSELFLPEKTRLIGRGAIVHPDSDEDDPDAQRIDTRLRNACLHQVLRWLMIARGKKKGREPRPDRPEYTGLHLAGAEISR